MVASQRSPQMCHVERRDGIGESDGGSKSAKSLGTCVFGDEEKSVDPAPYMPGSRLDPGFVSFASPLTSGARYVVESWHEAAFIAFPSARLLLTRPTQIHATHAFHVGEMHRNDSVRQSRHGNSGNGIVTFSRRLTVQTFFRDC